MKSLNKILLILSLTTIALQGAQAMLVEKPTQPTSPALTKQIGLDLLQQPTCTLFNPKSLDQVAITEGYGYKTANLQELANLAKKTDINDILKQKGFRFTVPQFVGLSNNHINNILNENNFNLNSKWNQIIESHINPEVARNCFESKIIPKQFLQETEQLAQKVEQFFIQKADKINNIDDWRKWLPQNWLSSNLNNILDKKAMALLQVAKNNNWQLMVRSTGKEDSQELSNAGGNHTEANVSPDPKNVLIAIGKVVASYIKQKSLMQRLQAGDKTIFDTPFTPVLIQVMVGETLGGATDSSEIPVGCVAYSQEPESKTDTNIIQCSFGHNEGVVDGTVATDSFYVYNSGQVYGKVKVKPSRLVPVANNNKFGLQEVKNPEDIQGKPTLDNDAIIAIKQVIDTVSGYYQYPVDIELIYDPKTKTINLVQSRPVVYSKNKIEPSYVSDLDKIKSGNIVSASTIISAGGALINISNKDQVITADSLASALDIYIAPRFNKENTKAIIVRGNADTTSHAAAIFRGDNKAILIANDFDKFQSWLDAEDLSLILDPQRNIIINSKDKILETRPGWFTCPIPKQHSVSENTNNTCIKPAQTFHKLENLNTLVETLKTGSTQDAQQALLDIQAVIINQTQEIIDDANKLGLTTDSPIVQDKLEKIENLLQNFQETKEDIISALNLPSRNINRLCAINPIESILFQENDKNIVNSYSLTSVMNSWKQDKEFIHKLSPAILEDHQLFIYTKEGIESALTPEIEKLWIDFIDKANQKDPVKLKELIGSLIELNYLPVWINTSFTEPKEFNQLYSEYQDSKEFIKILISKNQAIASYDLTKWENPNNFKKNSLELKQTFLDFFVSDNLKSIFRSNSSFLKIATSVAMKNFVVMFDNSIKALKGSLDYNDSSNKKVKHFKVMLKSYFLLLESWTDLIYWNNISSFSLINRCFYKSYPKSSNCINEYLEAVRNAIKNLEINKEQLLPSKNFNQKTFLLNSPYYDDTDKTLYSFYGITPIERLANLKGEDYYSLIHQNLLITIGILNSELLNENSISSNLIQKLKYVIGADSADNPLESILTKTMLTGIDFTKEKTTLTYSVSLRGHGVTFEIIQDRTFNILYLNINFSAENEHNRWTDIKEIGNITQRILTDITMTKNESNQYGASLSYKILPSINLDDNLKVLKAIIERMIIQTTNGYLTQPSEVLNEITKLSENYIIPNTTTTQSKNKKKLIGDEPIEHVNKNSRKRKTFLILKSLLSSSLTGLGLGSAGYAITKNKKLFKRIAAITGTVSLPILIYYLTQSR